MVYTVYMDTLTPHYRTLRAGREHLKDVIDAAVDGRPSSISRDNARTAALDDDRLVHFLTQVHPSGTQIIAENNGWSIFIPGLPISADGATIEEALSEMVLALRDYADAWTARLRLAPNHSENWGLVQIIEYSSDEQLKNWLTGR